MANSVRVSYKNDRGILEGIYTPRQRNDRIELRAYTVLSAREPAVLFKFGRYNKKKKRKKIRAEISKRFRESRSRVYRIFTRSRLNDAKTSCRTVVLSYCSIVKPYSMRIKIRLYPGNSARCRSLAKYLCIKMLRALCFFVIKIPFF